MNKTLMLVICDFLLLSMLALARFDPPEERPEVTLDATASSATAEAELISLLEESLQSELESRSGLSEDLTETRKDLEEQALNLAAREAALTATQKSLQEKAAEAAQLTVAKASIEADQAKLTEEKALVEADRQALALKFESTRTELESAQTERIELTQTLGQLKQETSVSKERLTQAEKDLITREVALAQSEAELKAAQAETKKLNLEREALNKQLAVANAERSLLEQNLIREKQDKVQAQAHASRLTENVSQLGQGVSELAQSSEEIIQEMDASRPRTMSEIFTRFQNNRATIHFTSSEKPRIGSPATQHYESKSILIADTEGTYLVTHTADTPFAFFKNPDNLLSVQLDVTLAGRTFPIDQIAFLSADPRLIYIPLPKRTVEASGLEIFELAIQPERWEEAVLVKNDESNFGRTGFRRLTSSERFLKMERPALGELFADFASSRGDLAFSKNSQFIGVLTDSKHAVVIEAFLASAIGNLGANFNKETSAATIRRLKDRVLKLPDEVQ